MTVADAARAPPIPPLITLECSAQQLPMCLCCPQPEPASPCGRSALAARTLFVYLQREPEVPGFMSPQVCS